MAAKVKKRRPLVAALLSLIVVGLGQIYAGRPCRGLLLMALGLFVTWGIILDILPVDQLLWFPGGIWMLGFVFGSLAVYRLGVMVDAYRVAGQAGLMALRPYQRWYVYPAILILLVIPLVLFDFLRPNSLSYYSIPSGSMIPTLLVGDYVVGAKYHDREPERGDLAVYADPDGRTIYVKRIVGLPGDRIEMRDGRLHLNGELVPREAVEGVVVPYAPPDVKIYREGLPGSAGYLILEIDDASSLDNTELATVPPNSYFVLGDNRDNSRDSRVTGPIPRDQLLSRVFYIYWSRDPNRIGLKLE